MVRVLCGTQTIKPSDVNTVRGDLCRGRKEGGWGEPREGSLHLEQGWRRMGGSWGREVGGRLARVPQGKWQFSWI